MTTAYKTVIDELNKFGDMVIGIREHHDEEFKTLMERIELLETNNDRPRGPASDKALVERKAAFETFLRTGDAKRLRESKAMSISSDTDGGYTHIHELATEIIASVSAINPILKECTQVTINSNIYDQLFTISRTGSARAAESGSRSESTTATMKKTSVTLYDLYSYPKITNELLNSSKFNLEAWVKNDITEAFNEALATEFVTGDGSSKSVGLLNSMSANVLGSSPDLPWGSLYFLGGYASPEAISYDALLSLISALPARYRMGGNCKWFMSTSAIEDARALKDQNLLPIWRQDFGVAGAPMVLLGYPVVEVPQLDGQTYRVLFGDMKKTYAFVSHSKGLGFITDQVTAPGFTKIYASLQCAGGVMDSRAMVALRG